MRLIIKIILTIIILNIAVFFYFKYNHPFWSRSPVMHYYTFQLNEGNLFKQRDPYNEEVTKLLPNEKWIDIDTNNSTDLLKFSHLLDNSYMYDDEFKYKYNTEFIKWTLNLPYKHFTSLKDIDKKLWSSLLERDNKIIASITSRPLLLNINNQQCNTFYVDYLCISKENRGQYLAPKMILKVEPAVWAENQDCEQKNQGEHYFGEFNMYIFKIEGRQLPFRYICRYSYYYTNIEKLNTQLNSKPRQSEQSNSGQPVSGQLKLIKLTSDTLDSAYKYFSKKVEIYKVYHKLNLSEFQYIFLNDIIHCYLLMRGEDIVGFTSFYNCQFVSITNEDKCCDLFYIFGDDIVELFELTIGKIVENDYKYIFNTNLLDNKQILEVYEFEWLCYCYYHLYNYYAYPVNPEDCALLMP